MCEEDANQAENAQPIRLRVSHYLVVMAACALITSVRIAWIDWQEIPAEIHTSTRLSIGYSSILDGIALTSLLCFVLYYRQTGKFAARFPGHWMLLFVAVCLLLGALCGLILLGYKLSSDSTNLHYHAWYLERSIMCSLVGVNCLVFARLMPANRLWKAALLVPGVVLLLLVPQSVVAVFGVWRTWFNISYGYAQVATSTVVLLLLVAAIVRDRDKLANYDWLHWTGVGVSLLVAIGGLVEAVGWLRYYF